MTTPYHSRRVANQSHNAGTPPSTTEREWRCNSCAKLLGVCRDGQMHLRFARGDMTPCFPPAWIRAGPFCCA